LTPRSLPEEWQPQFIDQYDGSFACTKDGETLRETPPESEGALRQVVLDGNTEFPKVKETTPNSRLHYFQYEKSKFYWRYYYG